MEILLQKLATTRRIIICNIDLSKVEKVRQHWPFLRDRRIDQYHGLLKNPSDE